MKKYLILASAALVAFAACNKEQEIETPINQKEGVELTFTSQRPSLEGDTKTAWDGTSKSIVWTSTDKISVGYTLNGAWMAKSSPADLEADPKVSPRFYVSTQVSIDSEDAGIGTFKVPSSFDFSGAGKAIFYGIYPSSVLGSNLDYAPSLTVTIPTGQTPGDNTFDPSADIMVGKSGEITLTDAFPTDPIELDWTRLVAHGDLSFSGLKDEGDETVSKITLTFNEEAKVAGSFYVDATNGTVTTNSGSKNEIILSGSNLAISEHNVKAWISVLPVTFTALNVEIETNKAVYSRSISGISKTFVKNARNTLTINMSTANRTEKTGQLVADGYYVISYGDYMMTVGKESDSYRGSAAKNVSNPNDEAIWRINYVSSDDAYTILSLGAIKELRGVTTANNQLYLGGTNGTNLFTIEKTSSEATTYKIAPKGNTSRSIGYNTTSPRFALYAGTNSAQPITLDLTSVTVDETPVITIDSEEATKTVAATATSVTFAYTANVFATVAPTVTIASDANGIVDGTPTAANGTITVNLNANEDATAKTATLTVSGTGIATPITLTINQEAKAGDVFSYTFTTKSWTATRDDSAENWTSGQDGAGFSNGGIQVTKNGSGANGTSPYTFTDVSKIVVTYCTNASDGVGSIAVKVGDGTAQSIAVTKTGGTTARTLVFDYSPKESGKVTITVTCTTNSIYIIGADITAASINLPTAYAITCATGIDNGSVEADKATAYEGQTVNLTADPENGYKFGEWNVYKTGDENTKVTVTDNAFTMPAYPVTVSASFVEDLGGETEVTFNVGTDTSSSTTIEKDGVTMTMSNGVWNRTDQYRIYSGETLTVSVPTGKTITDIVFTYNQNKLTTTTGTITDAGVWSGEANSVEFSTVGGQVRVTKIVVTYN